MVKTTLKLLILTFAVLVMLASCVSAENMAVCTFDGLSVSYPQDWSRYEDRQGIFLEKDGGFFQINTAVFPEGFTMSAAEMIESGAIASLMKDDASEKRRYTSEPELISVNGREYVRLSAMNGETPLIQYIGFMDNILLVFTVKGETCQAEAENIITSLRLAKDGEVSSDAASGQDNVNKQIHRQNAEGRQELVGMISDPVPAVFSEFAPIFAGSMAVLNSSVPEDAVDLGRCYYSDSRYVYAWHYLDSIIRVYVQGTSEKAMISEIVITAPNSMDEKLAGQLIADLLVASYGSLSRVGSSAYDRLFALKKTGIPFDGPEKPYWTENGWSIVFERPDYLYQCRISYSGELEPLQEPPVIAEDFTALPPAFRDGLTADVFLERFNWVCGIMQMKELRLSEPGEGDAGFRDGMFEDVGMLSLRFENPEQPDCITGVYLETANNDPGVLWAGCVAAMYAFSGMDEADLQSLILLGGGSGNWPMLAEMKPYVCLNGVALQAFIVNDRPMAAIFGTR